MTIPVGLGALRAGAAEASCPSAVEKTEVEAAFGDLAEAADQSLKVAGSWIDLPVIQGLPPIVLAAHLQAAAIG